MIRAAASAAAVALGVWLAGCTPTGPPATGANSSAPGAVDQATHGQSIGGSNDFTPGHTLGAPTGPAP